MIISNTYIFLKQFDELVVSLRPWTARKHVDTRNNAIKEVIIPKNQFQA